MSDAEKKSALTRTRRLWIPDESWGVCVWATPNGVLSDGDGYLSMEGYIGDKNVEEKMAKAARYWMGSDFEGSPKWVDGARKVSSDEHDDQMERLLDGKTPDPQEELRLAIKRYGG